MAWFGHTQTLTSISKSVTTVASGILGLEDNLATFMKKVIYYDKFFQRVRANLPVEVTNTAVLLFARCYEYRDEIRDELESSLAYVADAGRWVVGMEDWTAKMDKRAHQISELVLLANALLTEYAMSGRLGGEGSRDELDAYLRHIAASVVLRNHNPHATKSPAKSTVVTTTARSTPTTASPSPASSRASSPTSNTNYERPHALPVAPAATPSSAPASVVHQVELAIVEASDDDSNNETNDNDAFNPFAVAFEPPTSAHRSIASSLASLSSIADIANDARDRLQSQRHVDTAAGIDCETTNDPTSPVNLHEYECLDMDSIPNYRVFRSSMRNQQQRIDAATSGASTGPLSRSMGSLAVETRTFVQPTDSTAAPTTALHSSYPTLRMSQPVTETITKRPQHLMDLNYSYDFQRELECNPFASPVAAASVQPPLLESVESGAVRDQWSAAQQIPEDADVVDADDVATTAVNATKRRLSEWNEEIQATGSDDVNTLTHERMNDEHDDETNALIAALAAATDDDFELFGTSARVT